MRRAPRRAGHLQPSPRLAGPVLGPGGRRVGGGGRQGVRVRHEGPSAGGRRRDHRHGPGAGAVLPAPPERAPPRVGRGPLPPSSRRPDQGPAGGGEHRPRVAGSSAPRCPGPAQRAAAKSQTKILAPGPASWLRLWRSRSVPGPPRSRPPPRFQRNLGKRGFQSFSKESWEKKNKKTENRKQTEKPQAPRC